MCTAKVMCGLGVGWGQRWMGDSDRDGGGDESVGDGACNRVMVLLKEVMVKLSVMEIVNGGVGSS